jgi:hypothetical protein
VRTTTAALTRATRVARICTLRFEPALCHHCLQLSSQRECSIFSFWKSRALIGCCAKPPLHSRTSSAFKAGPGSDDQVQRQLRFSARAQLCCSAGAERAHWSPRVRVSPSLSLSGNDRPTKPRNKLLGCVHLPARSEDVNPLLSS